MKNKIELFKNKDFIYDNKGYVYKQLVHISVSDFKNINSYIENYPDYKLEELACEKRSFVVPMEIENNSMIFTTHTIRNIAAEVLNITLEDENTCFQISN